MADVILKNASGEDVTYEGVDNVALMNTDGAIETFVSERLIQNQIQADWNQTDDTQPDYIKNKPETFEAEDELPEVTAEDDGKLLGVVNGTWQKVDAPEGGGSGGGVSSWNDLTDKPFGEENAVIFEGTFQDALEDHDGDGVNDAWDGACFVDDASNATLEVGKTYTLTWEGVEYERQCKIFQGFPCIGNMVIGGGEDCGAPVLIIRDVTGTISGGNPGWLAILNTIPTDLTISGLYTCKIEINEVKYLDNKYLDFVDVQDASYSAFIPETTLTFAPESVDSSPYTFAAPSTAEMVSAWASEWENIQVIWDGTEYICAPHFLEGIKWAGNVGLMTGGADTGEPFIFAAIPAAMAGQDMLVAYDVQNFTAPILPYQTLTFSAVENTTYNSAAIDTLSLVVGDKYGVNFDGSDYFELIATSYTSGDITYIGLGDPSILGLADATGYNFFVYTATASDGTQSSAVVTTWANGSYNVCVAPTPDITHTVVINVLSKEVTILKQESLCNVPWDKITGKPFGSIPSGTVLSEGTVDCDTQLVDSLYYTTVEEFDIVVGATYAVEFDGTTYSVTASVNGSMSGLMYDGDDAFFMFANGYQPGSTLIASTQGTHTYKVSAAEDIVKKIDAQYLPDDIGGGSGLPEVTTSDNGKVMKVVDGVWAVSAEEEQEKELPTTSTSDNGKFLQVVNGSPAWVALTDVSQEGA